MALRIAFDLDGVLADMEGELARQARALFGDGLVLRSGTDAPALPAGDAEPGIQPSDADDDQAPLPLQRLCLTTRQTQRLWRHVEKIDNFWETLKEIEAGAVERLALAAIERRWEVIFLTRRPESAGATAQVQTQRWLEAKGFALPSVFVVQRSRGRIAASLGLDVVVDDRPENCLDVVTDSRARAILVWREDEKLLPAAARRLGIGVVPSMAQCLDILEQIDGDTHAREGGVVDRLKRLLGLKAAVGA